jgi:hypothetical protein
VIAAIAYGSLAAVVALCGGVALAPERTDEQASAVQNGAIIVGALALGAFVGLAVGGVG